MPTAADVLAEARKFLGLKESPPGSNCTMFGSWYGTGCAPWCGEFASYVLYQVFGYAPVPAQSVRGFAYCPTGLSWLKSHGMWATTPTVGSLVFYDWQGGGVADHVEIVSVVNADGSIQTIGGNTGPASVNDGGMVAEQIRRGAPILGYGRVPYAITIPAPTPQPQPVTIGPPTEWSDTVQSLKVHIPALDAQGRGHILIPAAADRVVNVKFNGVNVGYPLPSGGVQDYVPGIATLAWSSCVAGPDEEVTIQGGAPNGILDLTVWVAQPVAQ